MDINLVEEIISLKEENRAIIKELENLREKVQNLLQLIQVIF